MTRRLDFKAAVAVTDAGEVTGLASVFGTVDRGGDVVHPGAFASAVFPIPMLASHDAADVIGVWTEGKETAAGLEVKGRLTLEVQRAAEVRALILAGGMRGLSIGYIAKKSARKGGVRHLHSVELVEISVVSTPMHPGATITTAKGAGHEQRDGGMTIEELRAMLAEAGLDLSGKEGKSAAPDLSGVMAEALKPIVARLDQLEAKGNRPTLEGKSDDGEVSAERKSFAAYLRLGPQLQAEEAKALTLSSDPNGGYLAPPEMSSEVIRDLVEFSPIRSLASVRGTNAPSVIYPTRKPMGNATWDDELDDETETSTTNIFGTTEVTLRGMSTYVDISNMLLQDAPAVEAEVREALAEDFGKKESVAFVTGNGTTRPEGIMSNVDVAFYKNGHATDLKADALVKFLYSIPQTYRTRGAWMMNGITLGIVRTLKDGQGNFLWQPSFQAGQPETILGRPVVEVLDMPDLADGADPIMYGDFSGYRILDRAALSMLVDPYSQATRKFTRIHASRRVTGKVLMPAKFKKFRMAV